MNGGLYCRFNCSKLAIVTKTHFVFLICIFKINWQLFLNAGKRCCCFFKYSSYLHFYILCFCQAFFEAKVINDVVTYLLPKVGCTVEKVVLANGRTITDKLVWSLQCLLRVFACHFVIVALSSEYVLWFCNDNRQ